jgi:ADP-ribose pyrophosphatase YjhB (NUDIX family)
LLDRAPSWRDAVRSSPALDKTTTTGDHRSPARQPRLLAISTRYLMKFCSACAQPVTLKVPEGDHLPRFVCTGCGTIHYENPRIIAGCVIETEGKILLCKRAIEPRHGYWTTPAGFMENGESVQQAAAREAVEEALAHVKIGSLLAVVSVLRAHQVHIMFRATLVEPSFGIGPESLESCLYAEEEIPWQDLAFLSVEFALRRYLDDRRRGREQLHFRDIDWRDGKVSTTDGVSQ